MSDKNLFNNKADDYELWFNENDKIFESEVNAIKAVLPFGKDVIEIGVGTGIFAQKLGIRIGVEPSPQMSLKAKDKGIQIINAVAENLPIPNQTFDVALMVTVDCFLESIETAFKEVKRILRDEGVFVIAFIDKATPLGKKYEKNKGSSKYYSSAHFHTAREIEDYLNKSGFKIIQAKQTVFLLENTVQSVIDGLGEGVFAVIMAKKILD